MAAKSSAGAKFRAAIVQEQPLQVIGAINAYHARLAERSGYKALYLSGGGVAAGSLGLPDLGISNLDDVLTDVRRITDVCSLPLLVDVDTGFGSSAFNVARTVKSLIKYGAGAMHIEDLWAPSAAATGRERSWLQRRRWSIASRPRSTPGPTRIFSSWRAPTRYKFTGLTPRLSAPSSV